MKVHLVGTDHHNQWCKMEDALYSPFAKYIIAYCEMTSISLIAEELNEEALLNSCVESPGGSVAWNVATFLKVKHAFCDPNSKERQKIGIPSTREIVASLNLPKARSIDEFNERNSIIENEQRKYWGIREKYWLLNILKIDAKNVFFVVGQSHIHRFRSLLEENTISVIIVNECWRP